MKKRNYEECVGKKYGKLLIQEIEYISYKKIKAICLCECGNKVKTNFLNVINNLTKSCGCLKLENYKLKTSIYIGKKFNKLKILEIQYREQNKNKRKITVALCECDCGKIIKTSLNSVLNESSKSCGCEKHKFKSDNPQWTGCGEISGSFWKHIICHCKRSSRIIPFEITIEYAWKLFLKQDKKCKLSGIILTMESDRKSKERRTASLDRIDSNLGYIEGNVQWVHKDINAMKWKFKNDYFIDTINLINKNQNEIFKLSDKIVGLPNEKELLNKILDSYSNNDYDDNKIISTEDLFEETGIMSSRINNIISRWSFWCNANQLGIGYIYNLRMAKQYLNQLI